MSSAFLDRVRTALHPRYRLEEQIGSGGMAVVFRAFDTVLERVVAVKVLPPELATAVNAERFEREFRRLARLSHPHLVAVHDAGEADGILYFVMDLIDAETLGRRLKRGPLDSDSALSVADGLLRALEVVHTAGLIHRDVKPENVFLKDGAPLLADFGIAKSLVTTPGEQLTREGISPGTPAYMSPEQVRGEAPGPATDLYAVGMILFECLTGRRWPAGDDPRTVDWDGVPGNLRPVLERALRRSVGRRWQDAAAFRAGLDAARRRPAAVRPRPALVLTTVAIFALAVGGRALGWCGPGSDRIQSIAIRPCGETDLPATLAGWGFDLAEQAGNRLGERGLRVIAMGSVAAHPGSLEARELGDRLEVEGVVTCSLRADGDSFEVLAELLDVRTGRTTGRYSLRGAPGGFLDLQESLAGAIADDVAAPPPAVALVGPDEPDVRAVQHLLDASGEWRRRTQDPRSLAKAETSLLRALELEPRFGMAAALLAEVYVAMPGRGLATARLAFAEALRFADSAIATGWDVAAAHAARGEAFRAYEWARWTDAEDAFRTAIARDSSHAPAHLWYALWLVSNGQPGPAIEHARVAAGLDPASADMTTGLGIVYYFAGRAPEAVDLLQATVERHGDAPEARLWLAAALLEQGRIDDVRGQLDLVREQVPLHAYPGLVPILAAGYACTGDVTLSRELLADPPVGGSRFWTAIARACLDDPSGALAELNAAWDGRDEFLSYVGVIPLLADFRTTPEYARFVENHDMPWSTGSEVP